MTGRLESRIKTEKRIQSMIQEAPNFIREFYYSLNSKTHTTKLRYITNVLRFLKMQFGEDISGIELEDIKNITSYDVEYYLNKIAYIGDGIKTKEASANTKAVILSSLSMFFSFMKGREYIDKNPFDGRLIERPKTRENDVVYLTPEEVNNVEQSILARPNTDKWKWRDMLLFRIPVINGLRVTALSEINTEDVDFVKHTISVVEKGDIRKEVYIDDKTVQYMRYWMSQRKILLEDTEYDGDALFVSSADKRISVRAIEKIITRIASNVVPNKHITPHKLRSTLGVNLYQATKDIYLVSEVLGHKSTEPTRRYTKVFNDDKRHAIDMMASIYQ